MNFEEAAHLIDPEIYDRFKLAVELGKWPDGRLLSKDQKEICLQAIMLYEAKQSVDDTERVGYIDTRRKTAPCSSKKQGTNKQDSTGHDHTGDDAAAIRILH